MNSTVAAGREISLGGAAGVAVETRADGSLLVRSRETLASYPQRLTDCLVAGAYKHPQRTLVAQRRLDGSWRSVSYAGMLAAVRVTASALAIRKLSAERPIMILSGNDIEHLELTLGAMWAGIPVAPVSPAYSLVSKDFARLKHLIALTTPGMIFAARAGAAFGAAIDACLPGDCELVLTDTADASRRATAFAAMADGPADQADALHERVGPDTIAKFLFTSGSTRQPKAVPTTQRMLTSNQQMILQSFPVLGEEAPVLVDWLPWNHVFGGSHNVGLVLYNGGTLYIDEGKPIAPLFNQTLANLREIAPTVYFNVPKGWEDLAFALQLDDVLAQHFFSRLKFMFFAGAGLAQDVWNRLDRLAERHLGRRVPMLTGIGMTETSPGALFTTGLDIKSGDVGLPTPGCEAKLTPSAGKLELRLRGPNVMQGYWRQPELHSETFDEEGYYRTGDALLPIDADHPEQGFRFDGRLAEDFKLSSGTFVSVGPLRARVIAAAAPYVQDVVLAGIDRPHVAALIFLRADVCQRLRGGAAIDGDSSVSRPQASLAELASSEAVRQHFAAILDRLARESTGTSNAIGAFVLLEEPPALDAGEITDKGSINQRAVLARRAALVDALYAGQCASAMFPRVAASSTGVEILSSEVAP